MKKQTANMNCPNCNEEMSIGGKGTTRYYYCDNCDKKKQTTDECFEKWFDEYFCNQQGDDSPYGYNDVKTAFEQGRLSAQEEIKGLKNSIAKLIIDNTHIREDILADVEKIINELAYDSETECNELVRDLLQEIARLKGSK